MDPVLADKLLWSVAVPIVLIVGAAVAPRAWSRLVTSRQEALRAELDAIAAGRTSPQSLVMLQVYEALKAVAYAALIAVGIGLAMSAVAAAGPPARFIADAGWLFVGVGGGQLVVCVTRGRFFLSAYLDPGGLEASIRSRLREK